MEKTNPESIAALCARLREESTWDGYASLYAGKLCHEAADALEQAQVDAARWRYFRDDMDDGDKLHMIANGTDHYDAAIDGARGEP